MGIRVHKAIGFGVRGIKPTKSLRSKYDQMHEMTLGDFILWVEKYEDEVLKFANGVEDKFRRSMLKIDVEGIKDDEKLDQILGRHILWDDEFGIKDAMLFIPIGYLNSWSRYDDSVDWCEETEFHNQKKRYMKLKRELYPFSKGVPPLSVAAMALWLGIPDVWPKLHEALYVYWA